MEKKLAKGMKCPACRGSLLVEERIKLMDPPITHLLFYCVGCTEGIKNIAEYEFCEEKLAGPISDELAQEAINISWRAKHPKRSAGFANTLVGMLASMDADEGNPCPFIGPPEDE